MTSKTVLLTALNASFTHTNLAIRQIDAYCKALGVPDDISLICFETYINLPRERILRDIMRRKPDAVCFSCYIWNITIVLGLCESLKKLGVRTLLGGPEVSFDASLIMENNSCVDAIITGEGERSFYQLLNLPLGEWKGVICDAAPLEPSEWPLTNISENTKILYTETSRGCPFSCAFCLSGRNTDAVATVKALPKSEAVSRLLELARLKPRVIKLVDRTFNFNPARARAIWMALIEGHKSGNISDITYHFELSAPLLDERDYEILKSSPPGLFQFEIGVQSTNAKTLRAIGRKDDFSSVVRASENLGGIIHLHLDLIAGLPYENMISFEKSFNDVYALNPDRLQLGFLKLLKGSRLWDAKNSLDDSELNVYMSQCEFDTAPPYEVLYTPDISYGELCHLKDIEEVLEWYGNARRYPSATEYIRKTTILSNPFKFYSSMAYYFRKIGVFDMLRSEPERAAFFYEHVARTAADIQGFDLGAFRELMRGDIRAKDKKIRLPECLF